MHYVNHESSRSAATNYMKRVLTQGHTLAKFLLQSVKPQVGTIVILSPSPLDSSQALEFDSGHFPQEPVSATIGGLPGAISPIADSDDQLASLIGQLLEAPDAVCLLENSVASAGDPWLQRAKSCVVTREREVFHVLFSEDNTEDKIAEAILEARGIPVFIGALGRLTSETAKSISTQKAVAAVALESVAETARLVFVGAYDGEGYVLWAREPMEGQAHQGLKDFEF
jgi:hypothetical protein